ncbi:alpha/beta fold hydrolase [Streptomyces pactum]|uniref:Alpha/beta fold hydrolase n=1 Tax=Streptomyces pactum TaxID=68249 RepID=A0ABS0NJ44_9ACTN|nr:alpha/beta hydrolase [Streptomyces pactum]MBH5335214.1 alpha/beta fold hydrolase [Streptomyces pactum]
MTGPYAPPVPARELTVTSADGARLHVEVHGPDDAPTVVLAHGWTCSTAFWGPVVRALLPDHRVVLYDQRGHGRSPAAGPGGCSTDALADDLVAVLTATLEPGRRAVLGGHSMGGMTVMAAATRPLFREHAAAVLLCSTGSSTLAAGSTVWPLRAGRPRTLLTRLLLHSRAPLGPVTPLTLRALRYATLGPDATPAMVAACARIVHACPRRVRADWGRVLSGLDLDTGVAALTVPTLVIQGTADRLTPVRHARSLAARLPRCAGLTELPGLGHMTPVEDPAAISDGLRRLVRDHLAPAADARPGAPDTDAGTAGPAPAGTGRAAGGPADPTRATPAPEAAGGAKETTA